MFVLDHGNELFLWFGEGAGVFEKRKGQEIVNAIKEQRNGRPKVTLLDGAAANDTFWGLLGGAGPIAAATPDTDAVAATAVVLRLSDATGKLTLTEVGRGAAVKRTLLSSTDVFLVDVGHSVFVFVGSSCSDNEKRSALKYGHDYVGARVVGLVRVVEGFEPASFTAVFH